MKLRANFEHVRPPKEIVERKLPAPRTETKVSPAPRKLALAHYIDRLIERGVIVDYTQAARMLGVSQARMSHVMGLLLLSPAMQEAILLGEIKQTDKALRRLTRVAEWAKQAGT